MFSLIITLISIALVVVLALATIYYGGSAFRQGQTAARAATLVNQGQQIMAAFDLYESKHGKWPESLDVLVAEKFLTQIPATYALAPVREFNLISTAYADAIAIGPWTKLDAVAPTIVIQTGITLPVCQAINQKIRGDNGVLKQPYANSATQCFGPDVDTLTVVVTRGGATALIPAAIGGGIVAVGEPPLASDATAPGWLTAPNTAATPLASPPANPTLPLVTVSYTGLSFLVNYPQTVQYQGLDVTNPGPLPLTLTAALTSDTSPNYSLGYSDCATLGAGQTCYLEVKFSAGNSSVAHMGTLTIGGVNIGLSSTPGILPANVPRLVLHKGRNNGVNWSDYVYADNAFTTKAIYPVDEHVQLAGNSDFRCGNTYAVSDSVFIGYGAGVAGPVNDICFVRSDAPMGDQVMEVLSAYYQSFYVPVTIVDGTSDVMPAAPAPALTYVLQGGATSLVVGAPKTLTISTAVGAQTITVCVDQNNQSVFVPSSQDPWLGALIAQSAGTVSCTITASHTVDSFSYEVPPGGIVSTTVNFTIPAYTAAPTAPAASGPTTAPANVIAPTDLAVATSGVNGTRAVPVVYSNQGGTATVLTLNWANGGTGLSMSSSSVNCPAQSACDTVTVTAQRYPGLYAGKISATASAGNSPADLLIGVQVSQPASDITLTGYWDGGAVLSQALVGAVSSLDGQRIDLTIPTNITIRVPVGVVMGGTSSVAALKTGSFVAGTTLTLIVEGVISGSGGNGGGASAASDGGVGLELNMPVTIVNTGTIQGGGGGGASAGSPTSGFTCAGGGGAGSPVGQNGNGGTLSRGANPQSGFGNCGAGYAPGEGYSGLRALTAGGRPGAAIVTHGNAITWVSGNSGSNLKGAIQ